MSMRFSYEWFIESENAIVAVKRARTFHSRARKDSLYLDSTTRVLNRVIMVLAWRDSRDTGRILYVHLHLENSQDVPDERANHLNRRCSESVCVRIEAGYVTGNVSLLHCLRYMSALVCPRGNSRFQSEDSIAFILQLLSRVTKAGLPYDSKEYL